MSRARFRGKSARKTFPLVRWIYPSLGLALAAQRRVFGSGWPDWFVHFLSMGLWFIPPSREGRPTFCSISSFVNP
jgi:hypothetical protein